MSALLYAHTYGTFMKCTAVNSHASGVTLVLSVFNARNLTPNLYYSTSNLKLATANALGKFASHTKYLQSSKTVTYI